MNYKICMKIIPYKVDNFYKILNLAYTFFPGLKNTFETDLPPYGVAYPLIAKWDPSSSFITLMYEQNETKTLRTKFVAPKVLFINSFVAVLRTVWRIGETATYSATWRLLIPQTFEYHCAHAMPK